MESDILCRRNHRQRWNPTFYVGKTTVNDGIRHSMSEKAPSAMESDILCRKKLPSTMESDILCRKNHRQKTPSTMKSDTLCRKRLDPINMKEKKSHCATQRNPCTWSPSSSSLAAKLSRTQNQSLRLIRTRRRFMAKKIPTPALVGHDG